MAATLRPPRGGGSCLVLVYLRPVEGPVRLAQTAKEEMLPADTVSLRGLHEASSASFAKLQTGIDGCYWNRLPLLG